MTDWCPHCRRWLPIGHIHSVPNRVRSRSTTTPHALKCQAASRSRLLGKPPTPHQAKLLEVIRQNPGQLKSFYVTALFGTNNDWGRSQVRDMLKGLLRRNLVEFYPACHCGGSLFQYGQHAFKCEECGWIYADVYVKAERLRLV